MALIPRHNNSYTGNTPDAVGDKYYAQDKIGDYYSLQQQAGNLFKLISRQFLSNNSAVIGGLSITTTGSANSDSVEVLSNNRFTIFPGGAVFSISRTVPGTIFPLPGTSNAEIVPVCVFRSDIVLMPFVNTTGTDVNGDGANDIFVALGTVGLSTQATTTIGTHTVYNVNSSSTGYGNRYLKLRYNEHTIQSRLKDQGAATWDASVADRIEFVFDETAAVVGSEILIATVKYIAHGGQIPLYVPNSAGTGVEDNIVIAPNAGGAYLITPGGIVSSDIADNAITTSKIPDNSIITAKIPNDAVTTAKITNSAITTAKMADGAVEGGKLDQTLSYGGAISLSGSIQTTSSGSISTRLTGKPSSTYSESSMSFASGVITARGILLPLGLHYVHRVVVTVTSGALWLDAIGVTSRVSCPTGAARSISDGYIVRVPCHNSYNDGAVSISSGANVTRYIGQTVFCLSGSIASNVSYAVLTNAGTNAVDSGGNDVTFGTIDSAYSNSEFLTIIGSGNSATATVSAVVHYYAL